VIRAAGICTLTPPFARYLPIPDNSEKQTSGEADRTRLDLVQSAGDPHQSALDVDIGIGRD
jgi:hypothetical protein